MMCQINARMGRKTYAHLDACIYCHKPYNEDEHWYTLQQSIENIDLWMIACDSCYRRECLHEESGKTCYVEGYDDGLDENLDGEIYSMHEPVWYLSCGHEVHGSEKPAYCSTCGALIEEPEDGEE